jgi:hypothetical protein
VLVASTLPGVVTLSELVRCRHHLCSCLNEVGVKIL